MKQVTTLPTPRELIEASSSTAEFKAQFLRFLDAPGPGFERIRFFSSPPVKVIRTICNLLEHAPSLEVDRVEIRGESGCSDFRGRLAVNGGERVYEFVWDCAWKAEQEGMTDFMGYPDQGSAARRFGYRCFQKFEEVR